ncbi:hypothetical protein V6N13_104826 [Hibiscus sabdariffa]
MANMFGQFMTTMKSKQATPAAVATPLVARAPIEKLAQYRAYTFTGKDDENPEVAEYCWKSKNKKNRRPGGCGKERGGTMGWAATSLLVGQVSYMWSLLGQN